MERDNLLGPKFRRSVQTLAAPILPAEPLPAEPEDFWTDAWPTLRDSDFAGPAVVSGTDAALPLQLEKFPLWRGNQPFEDSMKYINGAASENAAVSYGSNDETAATEVEAQGLAAYGRSSN